ncbi:hypothetical protein ACFL0P_03525 [Candidatus Omnitrophota bacterium]
MNRKEKLLGEILIKKGLLSVKQLENALDAQEKTKEFLGSILLARDLIKEKDLLEALSEQFDIPFITIQYKYIDWDFIRGFSPSLILDYKCFPFKKDNGSVTVAITNPLDAWALEKVEQETKGFRLSLALVTEEDMREAIRRYEEYIQKKYL